MADHNTELRRNFEETATKNIKAGIAHGNETRKLVRSLHEEVVRLRNIIDTQNKQLDQFRKQLAVLQQRMFQSGSGPLATVDYVENMLNEIRDGNGAG